MEEEYILNGKTYTSSQLNQYAKQSNLSLEDYIYESGATVKKVNKYMLGGKEYTDVQLNQYAKKSNLSLKDYIYESGATLKKKNSSEFGLSQKDQKVTTELPLENGSSGTPTNKKTSLTFADKVRQKIPDAENLLTTALNNPDKKKSTDMSGNPLGIKFKKEDLQLLKNIYQENQDFEAEKKRFGDIFDKGLTDTPKIEENGYLNDRLSTINSELINRGEEFVVPQLQYQFKDLGFKFETAGYLGDYVKVTAPNKETIEISLDNLFDSKSKEQSEVLKKFIKDNTTTKRLFVLEKTMREQDKKFNSENEVDEAINVISNEVNSLTAKQKQFLIKKAQYEKDLSLFEINPNQEKLNELEKQRLGLNEEMKSLIKEDELIKERGKRLDMAVGKYSVSKAQQGSWLGGIWNSVLEGFSSISAGTSSLAIDIMAELTPTEAQMSPKDLKNESVGIAKKLGIKGPSEEQTFAQWKATLTEKQLDNVEDELDDIAKKDVKGKILPYIRIGNRELVGDADTTKQWTDLKEQGFWGGAILGVAKSLPAMIGATNVTGWVQRTAQMYAQISDGLAVEMENDPDFANITENEKLAITLPIGITSAVLEVYGLRNVLASKGVITSLTMSALGKAGANVTAKTFRELVENEVKSGLARGLLIITAAGVAEFETGALQETTETGFKYLYNKVIKDKDMFKTPDDVSDFVKDIAKAGAQEAIGGFVLGVPSGVSAAYSKSGFLKMDDASFETFANMANDDKMQSSYIATLKEKIIQGIITEKEAKEELNNYRNSVGLYRQLPDGLTTQQKKEAMNLLKEKRDLENYINGKDVALVVKQKNRINDINESLTKLSETEAAEETTTTSQGIPDEISQPIELSVNAKPVTTTTGIPDEISQPIELSVDPEAKAEVTPTETTTETAASETMETGVSESGPEVVTEEEVVEPRIKDSQIPLNRETFEVINDNGDTVTVVVTTRKDGSRQFTQKVDGDFAGSRIESKDNTLSTEKLVELGYGDIQGETKVEQGNDIMAPAMKAKLTAEQKAELGIEETTPTETNAEAQPVADTQPKEAAVPDWERERHDRLIKEYEEDIADSKEELKKEKGKNFFSRSRSYIKDNENSIKWYENQIKLLKENPIQFYKDWIKSEEETHNDDLKDKSKDDDGKTYKERVIENYGTTDFNVVGARFIEDINKRISDYEAVQKTANENAQRKTTTTVEGPPPAPEGFDIVTETAPVEETPTVKSEQDIASDLKNREDVEDLKQRKDINHNSTKIEYNGDSKRIKDLVDRYNKLTRKVEEDGSFNTIYGARLIENLIRKGIDSNQTRKLSSALRKAGLLDTTSSQLTKGSGGIGLYISDTSEFISDAYSHQSTDKLAATKILTKLAKELGIDVASLETEANRPIEKIGAEAKAETAPTETKAEAAPVAETTNEKKIAEATKKLADKVREIKVSRPDIFSSGTPGSLAWDLGVEAVAKSIEITGDIAQAVSDGIEAIKKTDWYKGLDNDKKTVVEEEFKKKFNSLKENIDEQGQQAISQGSTTMKDFFDYMSNNEDFNNLSESEKKDFYYNSVSTFSTSEAISQEEDSRKTIVLKDQNWVKKLLTTFQNKMLRVKDVQNQIEEILGTKILNEANVALKFELLVGKAKYLIDNIRYEISDRKNKNSFYNRLISDGGDIDDLGIYMYALHAPERNEAVSNQRKEEFDNEVTVLNQKIADAKSKSLKTRYQNQLNKLVSGRGKTTILKGPGSGMTNEQAQDIIDTVEKSGKKDLYDKYAKEFRDKVITPNLDAMLNYELIDQETYDLVKNKYTNYVPLQVVEKSLNKVTGSGIRGASVKGRDIFKARGSDLYKYTDRYNPIFSTMFAYTNTILRGERNKASQALINLAEMDENNDVFKIHRPKYIPIVNSNGDIDFVIEGTSDIVKNNSVEIKSKGKPIYIEIKDKALRDAINQQGVVRGIRGLHIVNTWLRNTATLFNPDFIFTNVVKDIEGSSFNIQSSKKDFDLKKITRKIINPKNLISAGRGIISAGKKDFNSEWSIAARELAENGGVVSWFQADNLDDYINDLKKDLLKVKRGENKFYKVLNKTKDTLLMAQLVAEQSVRLSTFKVLKDAGVPLEEAAREAKNITVNFENKGTWSGFVDSLYIFATAGVSGTVRTAYSLSRSKRARGIAAGIFSYGILESIMNNALASGDDEDELIEDGIKERNLVIVNPSDPKKEPLLIPLAYGINLFKHAGNLTYDVAMGRKTVLEGSTKLFKSIYTQISPFQGPTVGQAISPTMLDPIVQHLENKNWLGNPIKPEQPKFGSNIKESDLYFQSVRSTSKWTTKKLNEITGGSAVESGSIDISPEILDHYYDAFTGGTGKFISNSYYTGNAILQESLYGDKVKEDEQISLRKLPFLKSFFGSKPSDKKINYIYEIFGRSGTEEISEKEMIKFKDMYKSARKEGLIDRENAQKMKKQIIKNQIKIKKYKEIQDLKLKDMNKKQRLEYKKNNTSN